ncbi:MAG: SCO family protein [Xanthomonadales bacterium]|nr:SCO family protein [Xanthomonadales bacterium]
MALATHLNDRRFLLLAVAVALISAAAGFSLWTLSQARPAPAYESLLVLPEPRVLGEFRRVDQAGEAFSLEDLRGRWSLLFFGFTHCPDICPSTLYDLQQVSQSMEAGAAAADPWQVVFVSVDPERDTPERLGEYVSWFDPDFVGVTGAPEQLAPLAMRIGVAFRIEDHEPGAANYAVDHSASVFLTDPQGRLHGVFPAPHDAATMARDLAAFLN